MIFKFNKALAFQRNIGLSLQILLTNCAYRATKHLVIKNHSLTITVANHFSVMFPYHNIVKYVLYKVPQFACRHTLLGKQ